MTTAVFWRDVHHEDFDAATVTFEVAGHEFNHRLVHLWVDSDTHPGVTFDLTKDEALSLADALMTEARR